MTDEPKKKTSDNVSPVSATAGGNFTVAKLPVSTGVFDQGETDKKSWTSLLFERCLCASPVNETLSLFNSNEFFTSFCSSTTRSFQFVELGGVECISLGSITSELTPMERVTETIRRLIAHDEARLSIGYVSVLDDNEKAANVINMDDDIDDIPVRRDTETTPLDIYSKNIGADLNQYLSSDLISIVENLKSKRFDRTIQKSQEMLQRQRSVFERGENNDESDDAACLMGITLHNIAVVNAFAGRFQKSIEIFQEAVEAKKAFFGDNHHLIADSLHEMGILHFANERFVEALATLEDAKTIRTASFGPDHPKVVMVMNNIACLKFLSKEPDLSLTMLKEGKQILRSAMGQMKTMVKVDLLHMAITSFNLGYVESQLKNYDEARSLFEEALMVQQSVLDDTHETIKDTKANIDFTNAFHS